MGSHGRWSSWSHDVRRSGRGGVAAPHVGGVDGRVGVDGLDGLGGPTGRAQDLPVLRWLNGDETLGGFGIRVTGDVVSTFGGMPASGSITGLVRFSLYPAPASGERDP